MSNSSHSSLFDGLSLDDWMHFSDEHLRSWSTFRVQTVSYNEDFTFFKEQLREGNPEAQEVATLLIKTRLMR